MLGEKEIWLSGSGRHVKIGQLGAMDAREVAVMLTNIVGKAMQGTVKIDPTKGALDQDIDLVGALGAALERLDKERVNTLTNVFAKRTKVESDDGKWTPLASVVDVVFGGGEGLADWFEWLYACLEFSCGPFFGRLLGLKARVDSLRSTTGEAPVAAEPPVSPTESTGSSTASPRVRRIEVSR